MKVRLLCLGWKEPVTNVDRLTHDTDQYVPNVFMKDYRPFELFLSHTVSGMAYIRFASEFHNRSIFDIFV